MVVANHKQAKLKSQLDSGLLNWYSRYNALHKIDAALQHFSDFWDEMILEILTDFKTFTMSVHSFTEAGLCRYYI